jgi:glycosyltransferase involved in cell wall biosynthesis
MSTARPITRPSVTTIPMRHRSRRLRILHVLPTLHNGGAENMACSLILATAERHQLGALSLFPVADSWFEQTLRDAHIPMWHLDKRPGFDPRVFGRVRRAIREFQPDVVHSHMSVLRYMAPCLLEKGAPVAVHTLHNLAKYETDLVGRALQWFFFRGLVVPVAISREVADSFERYYRLPCPHLVPNCIRVETFRPDAEVRAEWRAKEGIPQNAIVFISTGRFVEQKNPFLTLDAFRQLRDPRAKLVLLGRGPLQDEVETYIRDNRLQDSVYLLGFRPDIPQCLAAADVFLLSSHWEGNPLAVMEAMAAGLPVISTAVGGVPSLVESGRSGILVAPGDCAAFAEAMRFLLEDAEARSSIARGAREHAVDAFSLDRMVRGYAEVYESTLTRAGR